MTPRGNGALKGRCARGVVILVRDCLVVRPRRADRLAAAAWGIYRRERRQGFSLVKNLDVSVAAERQDRRRVPGEFLGHLDVRPRLHDAAHVGVPQSLEVRHAAGGTAVRQEEPLPSFLLGLLQPCLVRRSQVSANHDRRLLGHGEQPSPRRPPSSVLGMRLITCGSPTSGTRDSNLWGPKPNVANANLAPPANAALGVFGPAPFRLTGRAIASLGEC